MSNIRSMTFLRACSAILMLFAAATAYPLDDEQLEFVEDDGLLPVPDYS